MRLFLNFTEVRAVLLQREHQKRKHNLRPNAGLQFAEFKASLSFWQVELVATCPTRSRGLEAFSTDGANGPFES